MSVGKWILVVAIVLVLIGLIGYARGPEHHRGDDVGEQASMGAVAVAA